MDYELIKTFIFLVEFENFTKTAEQLHVVQSTVSTRIKQLECDIGKVLFLRNNKNVTLTNAGETFLPYAKQLISIHESIVSQMKAMELYKDTLKVGSVHSIYDCHVQDLISKYMKFNKNIAVKVTIEHSSKLVQLLHEDNLDIAFTYLDIKSPKLICKPFCHDNIILVTGPQNSATTSGVTDDELRNLPLLYSAILVGPFQDWFYSIFPKNYAYPLHININSSIIPFLREGLGFSFMIESSIKQFLEDGSLVEVKLLESTPPRLVSYMIVNRQRLNSTAVTQWLSSHSLNL